MQLKQVVEALERIAPTDQAEAWDNVGLLAGDPEQQVSRAILTIDYTREVADEAQHERCDLVIAYHPPIFEPLKRLVGGSLIFDAIRRGVAIYSPHTALDVAEGGTNDMLAEVLGLIDPAPLRPVETLDRLYKLITFAPEQHVAAVSEALFEAGCGRIGNYSQCSFRSAGTGTFFGEAGTNPKVGQSGRLETAAEIRIETVLPITAVPAALAALHKAHPYETPAFDLVRLAAPPAAVGMGRIGRVEKRTRGSLFDSIKHELGVDHLLIAGPTEGEVERAACCAGSCGKLLDDAIAQKADLYLTGEMRHHDALKAAAAGMTVICALHSNSERKVLERVKDRLGRMLPSLPMQLSRSDRDPFSIL